MKTRKYRLQEPPFALAIEFTEGCNLYCNFCGLQGIREKSEKNYKFMTVETARSIAKQVAELGWKSRIGFAMRGEPTMNPHAADIVRVIREHLPRATMLMLSNGGGLLRKPGPAANVQALFDAGLNILGLDDYEGVGIVPKILSTINEQGAQVGYEFYKYPDDPRGNPHVRTRPSVRRLVQVRDLSVTQATDKKGNHNRLSNHAGAGGELNDRMEGKRCALPFRQMAIRFDGNVPLCCNDWRGEFRTGNVITDGIEACWQSAAMGAAREYLIRGERSALRPCAGCDHRSYRVGLLPDLLGKGKLHKPDEQTARDVAAALKDGPMTKPVLRPWEKKP